MSKRYLSNIQNVMLSAGIIVFFGASMPYLLAAPSPSEGQIMMSVGEAKALSKAILLDQYNDDAFAQIEHQLGKPPFERTKLVNAIMAIAQSEAPPKLRPHLTPAQVVEFAIIHPSIQQDTNDILKLIETPTQSGGGAPAQGSSSAKSSGSTSGSAANPNGASFSYKYDNNADTSAWTAQGALLLPIIFKNSLGTDNSGLRISQWGFIPSVAVDYNPNTTTPSKSVDSLIFKAGAFFQLFYTDPNINFKLNFLPSYSYGTDTERVLDIQGGTLDIEPQILVPLSDGIAASKLSLGYVSRLSPWRDEMDEKTGKLKDFLDYQLRAYLHVEGGDVEHQAAQASVPDENFVRVGPVVQLKILLPEVYKGLILTAEYHYLSPAVGLPGKDSYFQTTAELALLKSDQDDVQQSDSSRNTGQVSLKATYTNGATTFTQESTNTFLLGLSVTY